jgi:hypothetical protein
MRHRIILGRRGFMLHTRDEPTAPGRNDPCPCGSGKKTKHCHGSHAARTRPPLPVEPPPDQPEGQADPPPEAATEA